MWSLSITSALLAASLPLLAVAQDDPWGSGTGWGGPSGGGGWGGNPAYFPSCAVSLVLLWCATNC